MVGCLCLLCILYVYYRLSKKCDRRIRQLCGFLGLQWIDCNFHFSFFKWFCRDHTPKFTDDSQMNLIYIIHFHIKMTKSIKWMKYFTHLQFKRTVEQCEHIGNTNGLESNQNILWKALDTSCLAHFNNAPQRTNLLDDIGSIFHSDVFERKKWICIVKDPTM